MTAGEWPRSGRCGACARPARHFPSGPCEHDGRPCALRSRTVHPVGQVDPDGALSFPPPVRALLVFVPDGDELPQPRGHATADRVRLEELYPHIDWAPLFSRPTSYDRVRADLAAEAEQHEAVAV